MGARTCILSLALAVTAHADPFPPPSQPPYPQKVAKAHGCRDDDYSIPLIVTKRGAWRIFPEWVRVAENNDPVELYGTIGDDTDAVHLSREDTPFHHYSHDLSIIVGGVRNPHGTQLLATSNAAGKLEIEWEEGLVPFFVWPSQGDSVYTIGQHVFDCGHPPGLVTEIHPPRAIAVFRDVAAQFPETGAAWRPATRADVWASDYGGPVTLPCKLGLPPPPGQGPLCWQQHSLQHINDDDISFDVPAPARPSANATLLWRQLPTPTFHLPDGVAPAPPLTARQPVKGDSSLHIVLPFKGSASRYYAGSYLLGWSEPAKARPRRFTVTLESLHIKDTLPNPRDSQSEFHIRAHVNQHWMDVPVGAPLTQVAEPGVRPINVTYPIEILDGTPIQVWTGGYRRGCIDAYQEHDAASPADVAGDIAFFNWGIPTCFDEPDNSGVELGPSLVSLRSGDVAGADPTKCPSDYGTGQPQVLVGKEFDLYFHVTELPVTPEPVLTVTNPLVRSAEANTYVTITGDRFTDHESVQVALVDKNGSAFPLGAPSNWCAGRFYMRVPMPLMPGGDYVARATRPNGAHVDAPTHVVQMIVPKRVGTAVLFKGFSFGAGDTITAQHWITAVPIGAATGGADAPIGGQGGLVGVVDSVPPTTTADGFGSFAISVPAGKMPPGYRAPPVGLAGMIGAATGSPNQMWVLTGKPSNLVAKWTGESDYAQRPAWESVTMEPNHNIGQVDPVSLVSEMDGGALYGGGHAASMQEVAGYLEMRARNAYRAPLPSATLERIARQIGAARSAFARRDVAGAHRAMGQAIAALPPARAGEPPLVAQLRNWTHDTNAGLDVLSNANRIAIDRELAPIRAALKRGDRVAARTQLTALAARLPSMMPAAQAARLRPLAERALEQLRH